MTNDADAILEDVIKLLSQFIKQDGEITESQHLFSSKKCPYPPHSSLVDYLAQVKKAKNYPTHSECVFS